MAKEKKYISATEVSEENTTNTTTYEMPKTDVQSPTAVMRISEVDRLLLDLYRAKQKIALAEARTALANNENAELNFKYTLLQVYMKYGLTANDGLDEQGNIVYNRSNEAK